jgi:hypothetical protein
MLLLHVLLARVTEGGEWRLLFVKDVCASSYRRSKLLSSYCSNTIVCLGSVLEIQHNKHLAWCQQIIVTR